MPRGRDGARTHVLRHRARECGEPRQVTLPAAASIPGRPRGRRPGVPPTRAEVHAAGRQEVELDRGSASREREPPAPTDSPLAPQPASGGGDEARGEPSSPARPSAWAAGSWAAAGPVGPQPAAGPSDAPPWAARRPAGRASRFPCAPRLAPCERAEEEAAVVAAPAVVAVAAASWVLGRASAAALDRGSAPRPCRPAPRSPPRVPCRRTRNRRPRTERSPAERGPAAPGLQNSGPGARLMTTALSTDQRPVWPPAGRPPS